MHLTQRNALLLFSLLPNDPLLLQMMKIPAIVLEGELVPDGSTAQLLTDAAAREPPALLIEMPHGVDSGGQDATGPAYVLRVSRSRTYASLASPPLRPNTN